MIFTVLFVIIRNGDFMNEKIIEFYQELGFDNEKMYDYLDKRVKYVECSDKENSNIKCSPIIKNNILKNINISLASNPSYKNTVMNVYALGEFIQLYPYLRKEVEIKEESTTFPFAMQRLFVESTDDKTFVKWFNRYQKHLVDKCDDKSILIGILNHFDYLELSQETNSFPEILEFKLNEKHNTHLKDKIPIREKCYYKIKSLNNKS